DRIIKVARNSGAALAAAGEDQEEDSPQGEPGDTLEGGTEENNPTEGPAATDNAEGAESTVEPGGTPEPDAVPLDSDTAINGDV
ncbi:hypothetical protein, partial [Corynebacterium falsenii]|uniref:hypothetical protein n=1 Tax=Corynebacterium falsenii TaxID=108486 RepID=UPI001DFB74B1